MSLQHLTPYAEIHTRRLAKGSGTFKRALFIWEPFPQPLFTRATTAAKTLPAPRVAPYGGYAAGWEYNRLRLMAVLKQPRGSHDQQPALAFIVAHGTGRGQSELFREVIGRRIEAILYDAEATIRTKRRQGIATEDYQSVPVDISIDRWLQIQSRLRTNLEPTWVSTAGVVNLQCEFPRRAHLRISRQYTK